MAALLCTLLGACASDTASAPAPSGSRLSDIFATPDWAKFTGGERKTVTRPVTPDDLVSAEGACAGSPSATTALANADGDATPLDAPPPPGVIGGIALAMTECEVTKRAGHPQRVDIGSEGGERVATLTYMEGPWPGIYRFRAGRLISIERVEVPEAPKKKTARPAQPARPPMRVQVGQ
ncbi:MAG: hypothetical protein HXY30_03855 [Pseudorhodoplanes sp.]|nr:hypothetical protein [Pseudorhodoplanes sp.]